MLEIYPDRAIRVGALELGTLGQAMRLEERPLRSGQRAGTFLIEYGRLALMRVDVRPTQSTYRRRSAEEHAPSIHEGARVAERGDHQASLGPSTVT